MNPNLLNGLNISKIITTLDKGLTLASKVVPVYQKVKPLLSNTSYINNLLKLLNNAESKEDEHIKEETSTIKEIKKVDNKNLPTFFQ